MPGLWDTRHVIPREHGWVLMMRAPLENQKPVPGRLGSQLCGNDIAESKGHKITEKNRGQRRHLPGQPLAKPQERGGREDDQHDQVIRLHGFALTADRFRKTPAEYSNCRRCLKVHSYRATESGDQKPLLDPFSGFAYSWPVHGRFWRSTAR